MSKIILWLPAFRSLNEMVDRRNNMHVELEREPDIRVIFFSGTQMERQMFKELADAFQKGSKQTGEIFDSIEKHYNQLIAGMKGYTRDLSTEINDRLDEVKKMIENRTEENLKDFPVQIRAAQLLIGSFLAYHVLDIKRFAWADARDLFWVEDEVSADSITGQQLAEQFRQHFKENNKIFPLLTQGGLLSSKPGGTMVIENFSEVLENACERNGYTLIFQ